MTMCAYTKHICNTSRLSQRIEEGKVVYCPKTMTGNLWHVCVAVHEGKSKTV